METKKLTAILIDDMELARASLRADLQDHCPDVEIIGEADGVLSGAKLLKKKQADILFLDIEMEDGTGFDLLDIAPTDLENVIFVTARQDFAIKAFQYSALDYLLKPVSPDLLITAVDKFKQKQIASIQQLDMLKNSIQGEGKLEKIALHTSEKIVVAQISDIVRLESMTNYTYFYFADRTKLLITRTLKEFDTMLGDSGFERVHQSHLVNMAYVKAYIKTEGGYILMKDESQIPVSVRKKPYVISLLG